MIPKNHIDSVLHINPKDEDVLVLLDGDDWLYDDGAFEILNKAYQDENTWITWGTYV